MAKRFANSPSKCSQLFAIIKCPVEETGINSVNPSIIPRMTASKNIFIKKLLID
jgi:hypothetical protein